VKYLKYFENRAYNSNYVSILDSDIEKYLPKKMGIYTMGGGGESGGSYELELDTFTRETDILRVPYSHNTLQDVDGDITADGEPNILEFDLHFFRKENNLKIIVDVTYGDNMVSSFSIEHPNKINVSHFTGLGSQMDSETHFGLTDESIEEWLHFFNRFGFRLHKKDFTFIDKYPETYVHENLRLTPLSFGKKLLIVNNSKPQENRHLKNIQKWCQNRGIDYVMAISDRDVERVVQNENIVGAILTGSDFRITNPMNQSEGEGSRKALEILGCPILGICYGFQTMAKYHGSKLSSNDRLILDNLLLTDYDEKHPLFRGVHLDNTRFSFAFNDIITECPDGFKVIAKIEDTIAGIANDNKKRFGLLFHPEDMQRTYQVLDNFVSMFDNVQKDQDALKMGKFQYLESFNNFKINENEEREYLIGVFDDVIEELTNKNYNIEITHYDSNRHAYFSGEEMPDLVLEISNQDRVLGVMFEYTPEFFNLLNQQLKFLENFSDVNLIGTEYEYMKFFPPRLYKAHYDHLLDMKDYKHYITHRSVDNKLSKLRLYFRFEI
jgi:GMP synthase-like glutamine amidotransferase